METLRAMDSAGWTCVLWAAEKGQLPKLQWIVEKAFSGRRDAGAVDGHGATPVKRAAMHGHLVDAVKWIVSQLGPGCLSVTANDVATAVFYACEIASRL